MEVEITNGQNIIQLLFDEFASCLVVETALTVNWPDCAGSVGEYYALADYSSEKRKTLTDNLKQVLINGNEKDVFDSVKEFLNLFANGNYIINLNIAELDYCNFMYDGQVQYHESVPTNRRFSGAFYPYPFDKKNIFFTVPHKSIDNDRVAFYKKLIQNGARPKIITYELYSPTNEEFTACYLIDGHHKTRAYIDLGIDIPTEEIIKTEKVVGDTRKILNVSAPILKNFEFEHFLVENDENLKNVDFIDDPFLTSKLDEILITTKRIKRGIVDLFIKMDNSNEPQNINWVQLRLNVLSQNKYIGIGFTIVYWAYDEIKDRYDLIKWVSKTLPNNVYNL